MPNTSEFPPPQKLFTIWYSNITNHKTSYILIYRVNPWFYPFCFKIYQKTAMLGALPSRLRRSYDDFWHSGGKMRWFPFEINYQIVNKMMLTTWKTTLKNEKRKLCKFSIIGQLRLIGLIVNFYFNQLLLTITIRSF